MSEAPVIPLSERRLDFFFIAIFSSFAFTSFAADAVNGLSTPTADHPYFWARAVYRLYAVGCDPLLIANPRFLQAMCFISAFLFGPFYLVLVYSFVRGRNWIRPFALVYVGMIVESMLVLLAVEYLGDERFLHLMAPSLRSAEELARSGLTPELTVQNSAKFLAYNLPYKIAPILLALRMWKDRPFSRR